jgi:HAMP domain-containing protein
VLLFALACAFLGLAILQSQQEGSVTLAELASGNHRSAATDQILGEVAQSMREGGVWVTSLEVDLIFYAVLALCAILLALRAVVSAVRLKRVERLTKAREVPAYGFNSEVDVAREQVISLHSTSGAGSPRKIVVDRGTNRLLDVPLSAAAWSFLREAWAYLGSFSRGFSGKMIFTFTGIIAAFGVLTIGLVYFKLSASLTGHALQRARVLAVNVSDGAPAYLFKKDATRLRNFLRKLANNPGVAYALVEDRSGNIFAHSFAVLPQEVQSTEPSRNAKSDKPRTLRLGERLVYEVSVPILEGQIGAVRVALWKDEVDGEISATVIPLIRLVALVVLSGIGLAILFVWRITHPILRLVQTARRISEGELDTPSLGVADTTEFGELSRALERMRSSVKAALVRLHQEG